jgi:hypothetical protein
VEVGLDLKINKVSLSDTGGVSVNDAKKQSKKLLREMRRRRDKSKPGVIRVPEGYNPKTGYCFGGSKTCRHFFGKEPSRVEVDWIEFKCTRCGMKRQYEAYE